MENFKGMLLSKLNEERVFGHVMARLRNAGTPDSYRLFAFSPSDGRNGLPIPSDFVVRAEEHSIPQARHRVSIAS